MKFPGYLGATLLLWLTLALPAIVVSFLLLVSDAGFGAVGAALPDLLRDIAAIGLTLAAYGALFALLGVALRRPVIHGLMFLFVWELLANLPGYLPKFTLSLYARSLVPYRAIPGMTEVFGDMLPMPLAAGMLSAVTLVGVASAIAVFTQREYVAEQ